MVSYKKLRMYVAGNNLKLTHIVKEIGLAKYIVTKINNDENMEIYTLAKICKHLDINIEDAVEIIK